MKLVRRLAVALAMLSAGGAMISGDSAGAGEAAPPPRQEESPEAKLATGDRARGEELYRASCIVCHGSRADGGVGPRLAGNPVLSNERVFRKTVHEGRHVMPPLKDAVTDQQLSDIRAWLNSLR